MNPLSDLTLLRRALQAKGFPDPSICLEVCIGGGAIDHYSISIHTWPGDPNNQRRLPGGRGRSYEACLSEARENVEKLPALFEAFRAGSDARDPIVRRRPGEAVELPCDVERVA